MIFSWKAAAFYIFTWDKYTPVCNCCFFPQHLNHTILIFYIASHKHFSLWFLLECLWPYILSFSSHSSMLRYSVLLNLNQNTFTTHVLHTSSRSVVDGKIHGAVLAKPTRETAVRLRLTVTWYLSHYIQTISWIIQICCKLLENNIQIVYASVGQVSKVIWVSNTIH